MKTAAANARRDAETAARDAEHQSQINTLKMLLTYMQGKDPSFSEFMIAASASATTTPMPYRLKKILFEELGSVNLTTVFFDNCDDDDDNLYQPVRMSCVNSSDILRSARNALNQYPRFSLDGKDAMYRSSFQCQLGASADVTRLLGMP
ncbi:hypothetical protein DY000_02038446 [Brassica cretica]|uniref:Uncharacterized protein n=1 Tax=Brassica cretica TaxID=69181 RepID=A0ABQ7BRG1_BRACR|nr:hypothetical protein DY000_02038446 [Brassica cretica]